MVSNISVSNTNIKGTFDLVKEFAAQFIAINEGKIRIISSQESSLAQLVKLTTGSITQYLEELSKVKELLNLGVIDIKEFKIIKEKIINKF